MALIAAVGAAVGVLSLLVAFSDRVRGDGGEASAAGSGAGPAALSGSATNRPGAVSGGVPACGDPTPADGVLVVFRAPCGGVVDGPVAVVELEVPAYPAEGALVLVARELTGPDGVPHERPPVRVLTPVDAGTADPGRGGPGGWARAVPVGEEGVCTRSGRVELLLYLLGGAEAWGWRAGGEVSVPQGAKRLGSVALTRSDRGC
ncbi:hypothetical protein Amir_4157 [Actinosynnema mirum DSM 43827]|uniref:Uncharacterized protein n=1 Tax=Actinosynnema mirum (strain ATCC 29888 / DSM 43827 / JCM 3225 / NBRC 14064 / NCIMB 13271 / NRRL B-12336 / IMRU 3971 / 101) TaxID=446462 RepID=C6WH93_ACTMD|nr:hypothetical protein Amir_4157 [Actinosynnema mirum DSM 43827]